MSTTATEPEEMDFGRLRIAYDGRVLEPRPWTAAQSAWAGEILPTAPPGSVLELCSGAGQIGLLAVADSDRQLVCVDLNPVACDYARVNAGAAGMEDRVGVREARLESALEPDERFPVIIADPPWVPGALTSQFPEDPLSAIDGGHDGLDVARACLDVVDAHLADGGVAVLQLGTEAQADALGDHVGFSEGRLKMGEVQQHERGVLGVG